MKLDSSCILPTSNHAAATLIFFSKTKPKKKSPYHKQSLIIRKIKKSNAQKNTILYSPSRGKKFLGNGREWLSRARQVPTGLKTRDSIICCGRKLSGGTPVRRTSRYNFRCDDRRSAAAAATAGGGTLLSLYENRARIFMSNLGRG